MTLLRWWVLLLTLLSGPATAASLFGVVSQRSAAEIAAGAEAFARANPGHRIVLRTQEQLAELTDDQLRALWADADAILLGAVFGDAAVRLAPLLADADIKTLFAVHSDHRLTRLSRRGGRPLLAHLDDADFRAVTGSSETGPVGAELAQRADVRDYLAGRAYWLGRGSDNMGGLMAWLLAPHDASIRVPPPRPQSPLRFYHDGRVVERGQLRLDQRPLVAVLDLNTGDRRGDRDLHDALCRELASRQLQCLGLLARWGIASTEALELLSTLEPRPSALVILQDFVVGGGEGREQGIRQLEQLDVPVLKGIRLAGRTADQWRLSADGMPWDTVHYQVAMPEMQGQSQPMVLATATPPVEHTLTGLQLQVSAPVESRVVLAADRLQRWVALRNKANRDKRVAIVYYNHPPGRHNIGADNLDVPASLWDILHQLKQAGYQTGELPPDPEKLLDLMQARGINLPEDRAALSAMAPQVAGVDAAAYGRWFAGLPASAQAEVVHGPLGYLHEQLKTAMAVGEFELGRSVLQQVDGDLHHLLEGVEHPARDRAVDLLEQLAALYRQRLDGVRDDAMWSEAERLIRALRGTGIEGLRGWGEPPGKVMVHDSRLLIPGLTFGNVFIGPQPPRGWEINEELLHANTSIAPPHQYLAFYHWLRDEFRADAVVHLGRHSTYEFLPRRRAGLAEDDFPALIAGDLPGIYPYIVDGVGEGIQAKRRGLAVIVDHLTPPLKTTPLYDDLLRLRQLVESYESAREDSPLRAQAVDELRRLIRELKLEQELAAAMEAELAVRGLSFEQVDDEMLVHEVGHYLTTLQERFMPHGLHVYGRDWSGEAIDMMLKSMAGGQACPPPPSSLSPSPSSPRKRGSILVAEDLDSRFRGNDGKEACSAAEATRTALIQSPAAERDALLAGLAGRFIPPGKGNDPIRSPDALPTGRNFHALDGGVLPTRLGYDLGSRLAADARQANPAEGSEAVVLWASDTVRDEGAMVAFGLDMLGIRPVWNSRGILNGLERIDGRTRRDVVFTTSGLFRDLYPNLLIWLDRAVLLALDASSLTIRQQHPELAAALEGALAPLAEYRRPGAEPLSQNLVAAQWLGNIQAQQEPTAAAGRHASLRIFGDVPGAYGAGVNRLVERSGAWNDRMEIAQAYRLRMGHAYGIDLHGQPAHASFENQLKQVRHTYLGRASNLYGLIDNNDAFDYLGGLSLAVESVAGQVPKNQVIFHADPTAPRMQPLETALLGELRGRFLNPEWLKPLMGHGYAGARTMGSKFMEYLWGWQVTNPDVVRSWAWDEVKRVYLDDGLDIGLDEFLAHGQNVHVRTNMQAILLVAAHKGFWQADEIALQRLAEDFARAVVAYGLPGSGHTRPDHPMLEWLDPKLPEELRAQFAAARAAALGPQSAAELDPATVAEVTPEMDTAAEESVYARSYLLLGLALILLLLGGIWRGSRSGGRHV
jgi:cobaltochelatase CobN